MHKGSLVGVLLLTLFAVALPWPAHTETPIALVIGNSAYPFNPLSSPKDDAKAIEAKLKVLGFQVTRKTDLGRAEFLNAIRDFTDSLQSGTVALFYYSGHGMQVNNRNYMIPTDADIRSDVDVEVYAVPVENVIANMESRKGNSDVPNFVILDACRNNPFQKRFKSAQDGLARMDLPPSTLISFAAAPGKVSKAGFGGKLSLYTEMLVEKIDEPYEDVIFMFRAVHKAVYERSGSTQSPHIDFSYLPLFFSFKPVVPATTVSLLQQLTSQIDRNLESQGLSADDRDSLKQLRAALSSLSAVILPRGQPAEAAVATSAVVPEAGPVGMADSMVGPEIDSLQALTTEIERLLAKGDLSADEARSLQWLMLKRAELSMLISQIFSSAHESRKHIIEQIRN